MKFLMTAGLLAALILPAAARAQEDTVQLYGTLNVDFESVHANHSTPAGTLLPGQLGATPTGLDVVQRNRVTQNSANIGFRGNESLGGGMSAFFQIESAAAVDVGGSLIASRNSAVGLQGDFGSIRIGQWDTPYKAISQAADPMYFTGITYTGALIGTPGFGVGPVTSGVLSTSADGKTYANTGNASFERRQGNVVQYWTPAVGGLSFKLAYAANENRIQASTTATGVNPSVLSASAEYSQGPFYLAWAHERHIDLFGLSALAPAAQAAPVAASAAQPLISARDDGDKLSARYVFFGTQLGLLVERLRYQQNVSNAAAGAYSAYQRNAYALTLQQKLGDRGTLRALYGRAQAGSCERVGGAACDSNGLGAKQASLGYSYSFSKRTDVYWFYTRIANDARGSYQFANSAGIGAAPGAANIGYLMGIRHTF